MRVAGRVVVFALVLGAAARGAVAVASHAPRALQRLVAHLLDGGRGRGDAVDENSDGRLGEAPQAGGGNVVRLVHGFREFE